MARYVPGPLVHQEKIACPEREPIHRQPKTSNAEEERSHGGKRTASVVDQPLDTCKAKSSVDLVSGTVSRLRSAPPLVPKVSAALWEPRAALKLRFPAGPCFGEPLRCRAVRETEFRAARERSQSRFASLRKEGGNPYFPFCRPPGKMYVDRKLPLQ